jgi:hypothetical protein
MPDDFIVLGEGINLILIIIHLGSTHSSLKNPVPVVITILGMLGCEE